MKNFPDQNQFHELVKRLQSYTEQPDELLWRNIDTALRPNRALIWAPWIDRATTAIITLAFLFVTLTDTSNNKFPAIDQTQSHTTPAEASNKFVAPSTQNIQSPDMRVNSDGVKKKNTLDKVITRFESEESHLKLAASHVDDVVDSTRSTQQVEGTGEVLKADSLLVSPLAMKLDSTENSDSAQETKRVRKQPITFYIQVTPMLSFQRAIPESRDGVVVTEIFDRSLLSAERFAFSLAAGVQGSITRRFEYYGGISLYRQRQSLRYSYQSIDEVIVESNGDKDYVVTPKSSTAIVNYNMLNIGVNAGLIYSLYGKRLIHKIGTGLSYQRGFNQGNAEVYDNAESSYLSYQLFYRNEISVNRKLRVYIQPTFMQTFYVNEKLDAPFTLKPYSAGIGVGILYNF